VRTLLARHGRYCGAGIGLLRCACKPWECNSSIFSLALPRPWGDSRVGQSETAGVRLPTLPTSSRISHTQSPSRSCLRLCMRPFHIQPPDDRFHWAQHTRTSTLPRAVSWPHQQGRAEKVWCLPLLQRHLVPPWRASGAQGNDDSAAPPLAPISLTATAKAKQPNLTLEPST